MSSPSDRETRSPPASSSSEVPLQPSLRPHQHRPSFSASSRSASASSSTPPTSASDDNGGGDDSSKARHSPASNSSMSSSDSSPASRDALSHSIISTLDLESASSSGRRTREPSIDAGSSSSNSNSPQQPAQGDAPSLPPLVREDSTTRRVMEDMDPSPPRSPSPPPPLSMLASAEGSSSSSASRISSSGYRAPSDFLGPMRDDRDEDTVSGLSRPSDDDEDDESAAPHEPKTTTAGEDDDHLPETVPTVSAIGLPRIFPRHTDDPQRDHHVGTSSQRDPPPPELLPEGAEVKAPRRRYDGEDDDDDDDDDATSIWSESEQDFPPFLLAIIPSSSLTFTRRFSIISSSFLVHLGLPIINGFFLGMGEIFARSLVAPVVLGLVERGKSLWRRRELYGGVGLGPGDMGRGGLTRGEMMEAREDVRDGQRLDGLGVRPAA